MFVTGKISDRIKTIYFLKANYPALRQRISSGDLAFASRGEGLLKEGGGRTVLNKLLNEKNLKGKPIFSGLAIFCIKSDTVAHFKKK